MAFVLIQGIERGDVIVYSERTRRVGLGGVEEGLLRRYSLAGG